MKKIRSIELWVALAALCIMASLLFIKPLIGVANNGDFLRIMGTGGINFLDPYETDHDKYYGYFHSQYAYGPISLGGYFSSQIVIIAAASLIGRVLNSHVFDIRVLAALYSVVVLAAFYLFFKYNKTQSTIVNVLLAAVVIIVFLDIAYVAYFNSFFGEPVSFIFMLLTISLALALLKKEDPGIKLLTAFYVSALFLACSKIQNVPVGLAFSVLGLRFSVLKEDRAWKKAVVLLSALVMLLCVVVYAIAPKELKHINLYQTVFFGILKDSPDVKADLHELGLSDNLADLAGTNFFQPDTAIKQTDPMLQEAFYDRLSHKNVAFFYLKHPMRFVQKLERAAENGMSVRPYYLGNYEQAEGKPYGALSFTFSLWSEWKIKHVPNHLWFLCLFYGLYYAVAAIQYVRAKKPAVKVFLEVFCLVGLAGVFSLCIPVLGDGEADLGKHLFLFNVTFDLMAVSGFAWLLHAAMQLTWRLYGKKKSRTPQSSSYIS